MFDAFLLYKKGISGFFNRIQGFEIKPDTRLPFEHIFELMEHGLEVVFCGFDLLCPVHFLIRSKDGGGHHRYVPSTGSGMPASTNKTGASNRMESQ